MSDWLAIFSKDVRVELRAKHTISSVFIFALIVLTLLSYTLGTYVNLIKDLVPVLIWVILLFSGTLSLNRTFVREKETGTLEGLLLSPIKNRSILLGKMLYNLFIMLVLMVVVFPLSIVLFNLNIDFNILLVFIDIFIGIIGFVIVGSIIASLVMDARAREVLLPVVLFPLLLPVVIPSVSASKKTIMGFGIEHTKIELIILLSYILLMFLTSLYVFDYVVEE
ncbi:MAG: heme exporter protein CcmB [Candidatus Hydrothermarchaeota archaeon]